MKKVATVLAALALLASFQKAPENVYVCASPKSVAYHSDKNCRGLNRCTHEIISVTKSDAISKHGKRACKICYY